MKILWLLLLHIIVRKSEGCEGLVGSIGDIYPHDQAVLSGNDYSLSCVLNEAGAQNYTSEDLYFTLGDNSLEDVLPVGTWEISKPNRTAIVLTVRNATLASGRDNYVYFCKTRGASMAAKGVCHTYVYVGYTPAAVPATDFRCISENLASLTCTWQVPRNPVKTKYDLYYRTGSYSKMIYHCPVNTTFSNGSYCRCMWNRSTSPLYASTYAALFFTMNISNPFGQFTQQMGKFDQFANVRPAPAENLQIVSLNPRKAHLSFLVHYNLYILEQGLIFDIRYKINATWMSTPQVHVVNTDEIPPRAQNVSMIVDLPHPHLHYDFEVKLKSYTADASADDLWSDVVKKEIQALSAVPERPPLVTIGSFELIKQTFDKRGVYIYWKKLEEEIKNGDGFRYEIEMYDSLGRNKMMTKKPNIRDAYVHYEQIGNEEYTFVISALNSVGRSENSSQIIIPAVNEVESVPYPRALTKISYDNGTYELAWNKAEGVDSYNVFWCKFNKDRPYPCDGFLNWTSVSADQDLIRMDVEDPAAIYQFAIASVSGNVSSGMRWASCTVLSNNLFGKITDFDVTSASSTSLSIKWKLECVDSTGVVDEFRIYYCPYNYEMKSCTGSNMTISASPLSDTAEIVNLAPYTLYVVQISAITRAGEGAISDPRFNHTLEGVPDVPTQLSVQEVQNSSFVITWQDPVVLNGIITDYQVTWYQMGNLNKTRYSRTKIYNVTDLSAFADYNVTVRACTVVGCSQETEPLLVHTSIGVPGTVRKPYVKYGPTADGSVQSADIEWGLPEPASGPSPHYRVRAIAFKANDVEVFEPELYDVGPHNYTNLTLLKCAEDPNAYSYNISVQAYNPIGLNNRPLYGEWSKEVEHPCMKAGIGGTILIIVCSIVACGIAAVGFILGGVWIKNKYDESQSIARSVQFPWGPSVPTLGKPSKEFQKSSPRGVKENTSQSSMKPLFQRINSDLSFTHIVESQSSQDTETGDERRSSHSSVNSSGCSSAQDSEKSSQTRTRSRQSTDSGAFVNESSGRSSREKLNNKAELERSSSLGYQQAPPSYIQVPPGPPTLPGGYSRLGLLDTEIKSSPDLRLDQTLGYVPYQAENQSSPTPSNRSTNSESSLLNDHYITRPEIVKAKPELSFGDFELLESGFGDVSSKGYVPVPAVTNDGKMLQPGYVQVGLEPSTGYIPVPVCEKLPKSDYIRVNDFPKLEEPKLLSPGYMQVGFEMPETNSQTPISPKGIEAKLPIKDHPQGYVQVGLVPEKTVPTGYVPVLPNMCQASSAYVTLDTLNNH